MGGSFKKPFSHTKSEYTHTKNGVTYTKHKHYDMVTDNSGITHTFVLGWTHINYPCGCAKNYCKDSLESIIRCSDHINSDLSLIVQDYVPNDIFTYLSTKQCIKYNVPKLTLIYGKSNCYTVRLPCFCNEYYENTRFIRKQFCSEHVYEF
jgi:hypothetical protein